jgi:hypothetical protein
MMIVLDNARDVDQVLPLLPGTPSCAVVVTTRHHLSGLRMRGATFVRLGTLAEEDARTLLLRHMSRDAIDTEPAAVATLLERCASLPLALAIVAARTADHPEFPISHLADELQEESTGLSAFDAGDESANLRAVLSWSTTSLGGDCRGVVPENGDALALEPLQRRRSLYDAWGKREIRVRHPMGLMETECLREEPVEIPQLYLGTDAGAPPQLGACRTLLPNSAMRRGPGRAGRGG